LIIKVFPKSPTVSHQLHRKQEHSTCLDIFEQKPRVVRIPKRSLEKVREKHVADFNSCPSFSRSLVWLPHATILLHQVKSNYFEDDGTEVIVKIQTHKQLKSKFLEIKRLKTFLDWYGKFSDSWTR